MTKGRKHNDDNDDDDNDDDDNDDEDNDDKDNDAQRKTLYEILTLPWLRDHSGATQGPLRALGLFCIRNNDHFMTICLDGRYQSTFQILRVPVAVAVV